VRRDHFSETADFVAICAAGADPDMPRKGAEGHEIDHRPCIRCACFYHDKYGYMPDRDPCSVNPFRTREEKYPDNRVPLAAEKKKVAVVGGGPAGIQAMLTLVERGHDVTLYEKESEIGGNLRKAVLDPRKTDIQQYLTYLQNQAGKTKAKVMTSTEANPAMLAGEGYDAVFVALGAVPVKPEIPGIDKPHVMWAPDSEIEGAQVGEQVVILGGGAIGVQAAVNLAKDGKDVTIVEVKDSLNLGGSIVGVIGGATTLSRELVDYNVKVLVKTKLGKIDDKFVVVTSFETGKQEELDADTVLYCVGMKSLYKQAQAFRICAPNTNVYLIGDCYEQAEIRGAVHSAFNIASVF
jgi:NADPH-dependent 2,4-dienoyl-CoA reductase/sulfur reductase-like enzyme